MNMVMDRRFAPVTRHRETWHCEGIVSGQRVLGTLYEGGRVVRRDFNVKLENDNTFKVDIGTDSGVKIRFKVE
jgi:hypothetical protein